MLTLKAQSRCPSYRLRPGFHSVPDLREDQRQWVRMPFWFSVEGAEWERAEVREEAEKKAQKSYTRERTPMLWVPCQMYSSILVCECLIPTCTLVMESSRNVWQGKYDKAWGHVFGGYTRSPYAPFSLLPEPLKVNSLLLTTGSEAREPNTQTEICELMSHNKIRITSHLF